MKLRDFKFRVWDTKTDKYYYSKDKDNSISFLNIDNSHISFSSKKVDIDTKIEFSTNIKDKNDKEIYVGDLISYIDNDIDEVLAVDFNMLDGVFFRDINNKKYHINDFSKCVITGNINKRF